MSVTLDHLGICTRDGPALWAAYEALGFNLTPVARQSRGGEALATGNRCAMLRHGYLELLAVMEPGLPDNGIGGWVDRFAGAIILAFGMGEAEPHLARLRRGGLDIAGIAPLERPVEPGGPTARFERIPLPDAPEGRIQLVRHLTPELLWQDRWTAHRNGAAALDAVVVASDAPAASAARLSRLTGGVLEPDPAGGFALPLARGRVRVVAPEVASELLPGFIAPALPCLAGCVLGTADGAAAARALPGREGPLGHTVPPAKAGGAALAFAA